MDDKRSKDQRELPDDPKRVGHLADPGIWDNGLYTRCKLLGKDFTVLVDNGSSATLISKRAYLSIDPESRPQLRKMENPMLGANGQPIEVLGQIPTTITLEDSDFEVCAIICDIVPDGILGQDFLLKHATSIDYSNSTIYTDINQIKCWVGGEAQTRCRVLTTCSTSLPPLSMMKVLVAVENFETLSDLALFCASKSFIQSKNTFPVEGILSLDGSEVSIWLMNTSEEEVTVPKNVPVGVCESYYEKEEEAPFDCRHVSHAEVNDQFPVPDHLADLFQRSKEELTDEEATVLAKLLTKYQHVFSKTSEDVGRTDLVQHSINTGTANPARQPPRRQPLGKREVEKQEINNMLDRGIIEPSNSCWSSPIVLVTKKDGSTRFCVDYRALNDLTVKDAYPIPRVEDCLDSLAGSKWYSCMDLNSGFWQVGLNSEDKHKTAFSTSMGLYQFTVMPFGLCNSPSTFERLMEDVMRGLQWEVCLIYMDDIIIPAMTFEQGIERLEKVFERLEAAHLKLKPSKCVFFKKCVKFLGHKVSEAGVETDEEKIRAVAEWKTPTSKKQIRSFLGLCSYYRRFVNDFAAIARTLHKLCEKAARFQWSEEADKSFNSLKRALISTPVLAYPRLGETFILDTDSSDVANGAVLSQLQDGQERVIAYMSKCLNIHERSYCVTRKELLAVVVALKKFHTYLYGQKVLIRTDNAAVSWMTNLKLPTGQMARWLQEIASYDLEIVHRKGKKHTNADALSRRPCKVCQRYADEPNNIGAIEKLDNCEDDAPCMSISARMITRSQNSPKVPELLEGWDPASIRQEQLSDADMGPVFSVFDDTLERPKWKDMTMSSVNAKILWSQWDRLTVMSGMLYRKWTKDDKECLQLVVPKTRQSKVMYLNHNIPTAGHLGWKSNLKRIQQDFYWPGVKTDLQNHCRKCDTCNARKPKSSAKRAPLGSRITGGPMEKVAMDVLGPLPTTDKGNKYVLVICDEFTKWTEAIAMPNQEAQTIARAFVNEFVCRFGTPLQLHTDQGRNFESTLLKQVCELFHIHKTRTTSFRPQSNGTVERFNRTLTNMLASYCHDDQTAWDKYLPQVMMAYRATNHSTISVTPNMMVLGRNITMPSQAVIERPSHQVEEIEPEVYVAELQEAMAKVHELARTKLRKHAAYRKKYYDVKSRLRRMEAGKPVWLHDPTRKPGICSKLANRWKGPYLVVKRLDDLTYLIKTSQRRPCKAVHIDRLLPYHGEVTPKWMSDVKAV